jgi:hypothetical protein
VGGTAATGGFAQLVRSSRRGVPERHVEGAAIDLDVE